jgi:hypothetical protein
MTLMKSLLLGSAATLMVVAGAQAADLPTKKGAPAAQYVKICNIGGIAGFIIPGSDTCLKIGGLISAQTTFGSTADEYNIGSGHTTYLQTYGNTRNQVGMYTRGRVTFDAVSNTAYGPLLSHVALEENVGAGFDSSGAGFTVDGAYLQWAGLTAGFHTSFFQFIGGGNAWDDLFSAKFDPTQQLAYTATFGGGFSATLSLELPEAYGGQTAVTGLYAANVDGPTAAGSLLGLQSPDIVAALDVTQGWGSAHLGGVLHQVRQYDNGGSSYGPGAATTDDWGWGVLGGVSFNIPSLGAGADIKLQGQYTEGAIGYTHLFSINSYNFSGLTYDGATSDAYYNTAGGWTKPTAWGVATQIDLPLGPTFKVVPEASYGEIRLSTGPAVGGVYSTLSPQVDIFVGGATFEWVPVKNLVFDLDLLYASGHQDAPTGWATVSGASAWKSNFDGFNGKLRIERDF